MRGRSWRPDSNRRARAKAHSKKKRRFRSGATAATELGIKPPRDGRPLRFSDFRAADKPMAVT